MENLDKILSGLDPNQKESVLQTDGPVLIVAGAGSGKTRVLTTRIAYMLENGCEPDRILALTFTKKAAGEMKERIAGMVGERKARRLYMGTFHSVFIRFLREYADRLGYPVSFTIYDESDSLSAMKACIKELNLDDKVYKPKDILSRISMAKNNLVTAEAYKRDANIVMNDVHAKKPETGNLYVAYQAKCKQAGVMDFDDILLNMNILFQYHKDALEAIASRFDYILVDEYQDTNFSQYLILKKLSSFKRNICVVGDDSQSIYSFRGAKIENILNFKRDYPDCKIFRLEHNYRSTQNIVEAANSLIARNESRIPKKCFSTGPVGDKIHIIRSFTEQEEASMVASSIVGKMAKYHAAYQDFAILYRTNSQSRVLEEYLRKRNLPYRIYSGHSFFDREEVKDMMAYFKLVVNLSDNESFKRVINKPARGIGATSLNALVEFANAENMPLFDAVWNEKLASSPLKGAAIEKIRAFCLMVKGVHDMLDSKDAFVIADTIAVKSGLLAFYKSDNSIEAQGRAANIEELVNSAKGFVESRTNEYKEEIMADSDVEDIEQIDTSNIPVVTLGDFLEDVSLLSSVDTQEGNEENSSNKITLMTVHSAKGLEFPYVYVTGMEENLFPSGGSFASAANIEEERRLFYVAVTRAKESVELSFAETRMRNGKHESNPPSRFVTEIDSQYMENPIVRNKDLVSGEGSFSGFGSRFAGFHGENGQRYSGTGRNQYQQSGRPVVSSGRASEPFVRSSTPLSRPAPSVSRVPSNLKPVSQAKRTPDSEFTPVSVLSLKAGQRVEHNRFGYGKILEITGNGPGLKAKIAFDEYGEKILMLNYAKIRIADND